MHSIDEALQIQSKVVRDTLMQKKMVTRGLIPEKEYLVNMIPFTWRLLCQTAAYLGAKLISSFEEQSFHEILLVIRVLSKGRFFIKLLYV